MLEKDFCKNIVTPFLKGLGVFYFRPVPSGYSLTGLADYICCIRGIFVALEIKVRAKQTAKQKIIERDIEDSGGYYWLVTPENWPQIKEWLENS